MRGQRDNFAPQIEASFGRSAQAYDRAARRGEVVAVPFGRYLLLERIKRGGMAEVYRAKVVGSEGFEKIVAIKRILPHLAANEDFVAMFIDEAKIVSLLNHQNICPVIELGRCNDGLYIVMEYVWGRDLRQVLNALGRAGRLMPLSVAAYVAGRIAEGLDYAHRRSGPNGQSLGIVHRDVSPQNVLVSFEGDVKVIDFGIARASERSTQTRAGTFKGKFAYMSPEQARGRPLDRRSDVFAVGILLHEMITGSRLFAAKNDLDTLERVRNCQVPYPTRPFEDVPEEVQRIAMRALAANPEERYQWAGELQLELDRFLMMSGELATASRLGTWICLNFAEHAAKALVDQERAARAQPPGAAPGQPAGPARPEPRRPRPERNVTGEEYAPIRGESRADAGSVSFSTTGLPEESASFHGGDHPGRGRPREPDPEVEFEVDDGLFNFEDADDFLDERERPARSPQPRADEPPNRPAARSARPSQWSSGGVVVVDEKERSHPDIRDSAPPQDRSRATGRYSWHGGGSDSFRQVAPNPDAHTAETPAGGIEISATIDASADEDDMLVLDDAPPPRSRSGKP